MESDSPEFESSSTIYIYRIWGNCLKLPEPQLLPYVRKYEVVPLVVVVTIKETNHVKRLPQ